MKLLLAFTPFHAPTSPPFGLAYLKGALGRARPEVHVHTVDWNLAFFRRWLRGEMSHLCVHHPTRLLGTVCPSLLVQHGRGAEILDALTTLPQSPEAQVRYMRAARALDDLYKRLAAFYHDLLLPYVEDRADLAPQSLQDLFGTELAQVEAEQPDLVGFSILAEQNLLYALALGRVIKERYGIPIALGGAMMSHLRPQELLRAFPWLDFVFFGEAEVSLVKFVDAWPTQDWESVPGLAHRDGKRLCVHQRPPQVPLDTLAYPDFSDFPLHDYIVPEPVLPIITCRGCYWGKCTFCSHTLPYGGGVRMRRPENVIDEMAYQMARYGVRSFLFVDEAITPRMLRALSQAILERGLEVLFGAEGVRVERAFDMELLRTAHQAGLRWIYVGIESSVQRLLDRIEKGIRIETIVRLIEDCRMVGIVPQLSFIVGLPGTTPEELVQEIRFMQRYPVDSSTYVLLHGSPMHERHREFGLRIEDPEVIYRTPRGPVRSPRYYFTVTEGLSPFQADALVEAARPRPRMRPHLGEVHAVLLADTDFFTSMERPPDPPMGPEAAIEALAQTPMEDRDGRWFLHMVAALEAGERFQEALTLAQAGIALADPKTADALWLHVAAILNQAQQPRRALAILRRLPQADPSLLPAVQGERVRAWYALGHPEQVVAEGEAMLAAGHEIRWIFMIMALCYEELGAYRKALAMYQAAEERFWAEPAINQGRARCLRALRRKALAREEEAKAQRKARDLTVPAALTIKTSAVPT